MTQLWFWRLIGVTLLVLNQLLLHENGKILAVLRDQTAVLNRAAAELSECADNLRAQQAPAARAN
jgi:hypothetical protein